MEMLSKILAGFLIRHPATCSRDPLAFQDIKEQVISSSIAAFTVVFPNQPECEWTPRTSRGMTGTFYAPSPVRHKAGALLAEPVDAHDDLVSGFEELRRLHARAHPVRRARRDNVTGQKAHELAEIGNELGDRM